MPKHTNHVSSTALATDPAAPRRNMRVRFVTAAALFAAAAGWQFSLAAHERLPEIELASPANVDDLAQVRKTLVLPNLTSGFALLRNTSDVASRPLPYEQASTVVSPLSVQMALSMAAMGSSRNTAREFSDTFGWEECAPHGLKTTGEPKSARPENYRGPESFAQDWKSLLASTNLLAGKESDGQSLVAVARIIHDKDLRIAKPYNSLVRTAFGDVIAAGDFDDKPAIAKDVNDWVKRTTRGMIPQLMTAEDVKPGGAVLVSALYFKGKWSQPFWKSATSEQNFSTSEGEVERVRMMTQVSIFAYAEDAGAQVAVLRYDNGCSMVLMLPPAGKFDSFIADLTGERFTNMLGMLQPRKVDLRMPKLKLEKNFSLKPALMQMGLRDAFTDKANFSNFATNKPLYIADVRHIVKMDIDEDGTEAAAVTGVIMGVTSAPAKREPDPTKLYLDRPFVLALRHDATGQLLFVAAVRSTKR